MGCQGKTSTQDTSRCRSLEGNQVLPEVHLFLNSDESIPEICSTSGLG